MRVVLRQEDGAVMVIAAVAFILIIAFCGLVIDLGSAYIEQSSLQNAADASVFACGTLLPVQTGDSARISQVIQTAKDYAVKNGHDASCIDSVQLENVVDGKYYGVRVTMETQVDYSFGPIVGINGTPVIKHAKVSLKPITSSNNTVPLGIEAGQYASIVAQSSGQDLIIKYDGGGGTQGFFGALDLDGVQGGGAKDFNSWLAFGYDGTLKVGDVLFTESGNMAGPTSDAFVTRYYQCTHFASSGGCTAQHFDKDCPRIVTIIVYSFTSHNTVEVKGFLPVILEGLNGNGEIVGSLITLELNRGETNGELGGAGDYGLYRACLVE